MTPWISRRRTLPAAGVAAIVLGLIAPARPGVRAQSAIQAATSGTGLISGRVVNGATGEPVAGFPVTLTHQGPTPTGPTLSFDAAAPRMGPATQTPGADGRFEFTSLPAGSFVLRVPKPVGYQSGFFGMEAPADSPGSSTRIDLRADERLTDLVFKLWPVGSISGRVTDERNEPVVRGAVHLLTRESMAGRITWMRYGLPVQTNDRGAFVVANVPGGSYLVALAGDRSAGSGHDPVFHPSARTAAGATAVMIGAGDRRTDVDITTTFSPNARAVAVSGRVTGSGSPLPSLLLRLVRTDVDDSLIDYESLTASMDAQGRFTFPRVLPGDYRLLALVFPPVERGAARGGGVSSFDGFSTGPVQTGGVVPLPALPTWVLDHPVTVDRPIDNLDVAVQSGGRIRGRLVFDDSGPTPAADSFRQVLITVRSAHVRQLGDVPFGGVEPDGSFQTVGLPAGRYILTVRLPLNLTTTTDLTGWYVRSLRVGGRETIGEAVELGSTDLTNVDVFLTKRPMGLSGTVRSADGRPAAWARVILFARDPALWTHYLAFPAPRRIRQMVTDRFGGFRGAGVPPGEYQIAAVATLPEFWMAPEFLQTLTGIAVPVDFQPGDTRVVDLTLKK